MSQVGSMNPWLTMWSQPKSTVRALVHTKPAYGVIYLASIYALQSFFFYSNWWSLGLHANFYTILLLGIVLSPLIGLVWIYYLGFIFYLTGRLLKGIAPASHLRTAIAWSMIPFSISLFMWFVLIFMSPHYAFIQDVGGPSSLFLNLISMILGVWSMVLLIQGLCEIQQFTLCRSIVNLFLAWFISSSLVLFAFTLIRYIYIIH